MGIMAIAGVFLFLSTPPALAETVLIADTFMPGTVGNRVIFTVHNRTGERVTGVKLTPEFPLQWSRITKITPPSAPLNPGESIDFTIEFSILDEAPEGATDSITLFFENNENIEFDNRRFQINLEFGGDGEMEPKYSTAYFKVLVEGSGYTATYGDGTYKVSGSEERYLVVNRGESVGERLEEFRKYIEGDPCERTWPRTIDPGTTGAPALFTSGPQVTITDGPYFSYSEFFDSLILAKNWNLEHKDGPHPKKLREMVCQ